MIDHPGFLVETNAMMVDVLDSMVGGVRRMELAILLRVQRNRRILSLDFVRKFFWFVFVSLMLVVPFARVYTCSMFFDMSRSKNSK